MNQGIAANGSTQVTLDRRGLSNVSGSAELSINVNSELNELVRNSPVAGATETVHLTTLDECMASYAWAEIDFPKTDAEGEEARILAGGQRFLAELSPLVQL